MKKLLSVFLTLAMLLGMISAASVSVSAEVASGTWGDNLTWSIDQDGTLTISGKGDMKDSPTGDDTWKKFLTSIKKVIIKPGVTSIGRDAFFNCSSMTSISIPEGVTSIGRAAFVNCSSLTDINIPDSVTRIMGDNETLGGTSVCPLRDTAYYKDERNWTGDVLYIGKHLIASNTDISGEYSVKPGTKTIADGAFWYCKKLQSIIIPDGVVTVGEDAFNSCDALAEISLPDSVINICEGAFGYDVIGNFSSGTKIAYTKDESNWENNVLYIGHHLIFVRKEIFGNYSIKEGTKTIAYGAFNSYCPQLTSLTMPDSVVSVCDSGLRGTPIKNIGKGLVYIGRSAFSSCDSLTNVVLPNSVISMGEYAFQSCNSLENVTLGTGLNSVARSAFSGCKSLKNITIPENVTSIGESAFENCESLENINIPKNITSIEKRVFASCKALKSLTVPGNVASIGEGAFENCESLKSLDMAEGVAVIGEGAFENCTSLVNVIFPNSVERIEKSAFDGCSSLANVHFGSGLTYIGASAFSSCAIEDLLIPNNVKTIESRSSFSRCKSLKSVVIGDGVTSIGERLFAGCSALECVTIGKSVESIGENAFPYDLYDSRWYSGIDVVYVRSRTVASMLTSKDAAEGLMEGARTVILSSGIPATSYITENFKFTGTATIFGESVKWYSKTQNCTTHFYEDEYDPDCNICGETREVEPRPDFHTHKYTGWKRNSVQHWQECTVCGEKLNAADHVFDGDVCSVCGYKKGTVALLGDANGDGAVNNIDASLVLQHDAGVTEIEGEALAAADVNDDGAVNNIDASRILQLDAGVIPAL